jgi:aldose sugar dehydrogenase
LSAEDGTGTVTRVNPGSRFETVAAIGIAAVIIALVAATAAAIAILLYERGSETAADDPRRDPPTLYASLPHGYRIESITGGLDAPTAIDGSPDGRIFVAEQFTGNVRVITEQDGLLPDPLYTVGDLYLEPNPGFVTELGLVGLTVEPDTGDELRLWLYYSAINGGERSTKLIRVSEGADGMFTEETVHEIEGEPECCHIGGSLSWLPDGTLLVGVGDHEIPHHAQSPENFRGKILRLAKDGSPPRDNPFFDEPDAAPRVYAFGLRNPFGIAVDPLAPVENPGYVLDNGEIGGDTISVLRPGANYGWYGPREGFDDDHEEPIHTYAESIGPAGAIVYRGPLEAFDGDLFFCQFHNQGALRWFRPDSDSRFDRDRVLAPGCSSGIRVLPDGYIYYLDYLAGAVMRISDGALWGTGAEQAPAPGVE